MERKREYSGVEEYGGIENNRTVVNNTRYMLPSLSEYSDVMLQAFSFHDRMSIS